MLTLILMMVLPLVHDELPPGAVARLGSTRWRTIGPASCHCFFHPDGKRLVRVGGYEGTACVLDIGSGEVVQRLEYDGQRMQEGALSRDGRWLACVGYRQSDDESRMTVAQGTHVYELATGKVVRTWSERSGNRIVLSGDGTIFARCVGQQQGGEQVLVSNVSSGVELLRWRKGDNSGILSLRFSDDGSLLAVVKYAHEQGKPMTVYLVDVASQEMLIERTLEKTLNITYHSVDSRCRWLAFYDREGKRIVMEDLRSGSIVKQWSFTPSEKADDSPSNLKAAPDDSSSLGFTFSADGTRLVVVEGAHSGTQTRSVQLLLFDTVSGKLLRRWDRAPQWQSEPAISPDNTTIACGGMGNGIELFDATTGKLLNPSVLQNPPSSIRSMDFSPDGTTVALACHDTCIDTWDTSTWTRRARWTIPPLTLNSIAWSPDGKRLLLGGFTSNAEIWDVASQQRVNRFRVLHGYVNAVTWIGDGKSVAFAGIAQNSLALHDATTGDELKSYTLSGANGSRFAHQGKYWTNSYQLIQTRTGRVLASVPYAKNQPITQMEYSHQSLLALISFKELRLYERATLRERWKEEKAGWVMTFSPDGRWVAYGPGWDSSAKPLPITVRDALTGEVRCQFEGHPGMQVMKFSPDGLHLLSGGSDGTALVWKLPAVPPPAPWNANDVEQAWKQLEGEDPVAAARGIALLVSHPKEAIPWLAERLSPVTAPSRESLDTMVEKLNHPSFAERQKAYEQLKLLGKLAEPTLLEQLKKKLDVETQRRVESLLKDIDGLQLTAAERQALRAVEVVERINTPAATVLLKRWATGAGGARLTQLASECLEARGR